MAQILIASLLCGPPLAQAARDSQSVQLSANDFKFGSASVHDLSLVPRVSMTIRHRGCREVAGVVRRDLAERAGDDGALGNPAVAWARRTRAPAYAR